MITVPHGAIFEAPQAMLDDNEARLLHQLESVMRTTYVREMPAESRQRVIKLLLMRYTEA